MKKIKAVLLAAVMVLTMAACGTKGMDNVRESAIGGGEQSEAGEGADTAEGLASGHGGDEAPDAAAANRPQPVIATADGSEYVDEEGGDYTLLASYRVSAAILADESKQTYPALAKTLDEAWEEKKKAEKDWLSENREYAEEQRANEGEYFGAYTDEEDAGIARCDNRVLSIRSTVYSYSGGAHGYYGTYGKTYDVESGKELGIADVFSDLDVIKNTVWEKLSEGYPELLEEMESFNARDTLDEMFAADAEYGPVWTLSPRGIDFYFNPYTLTSYASGAQAVFVPYTEVGDIFAGKYLPDEGMSYIGSLVWGEDSANLVDFDGDGSMNVLTIRADYDVDNGCYSNVTVEADGTIRKLSDLVEMFDLEAKLISFPSGTMLVAVGGSTYNDYRIRTICDITDGNVTICGTDSLSMQSVMLAPDGEEYGVYAAVDPDYLPMAKHLDILSTYGGYKTYRLTEDGGFESDDEYYMIPNESGFFTLTAKKDFAADIIGEDGTVIEKDAVIPHGSELALYRTNGNTAEGGTAIVDARLHDGRIVRMEVTVDYPHMVDGIEEFELFDNLMYAG